MFFGAGDVGTPMAAGIRRRFAVRVMLRIWPLLAVFVSVWLVAATGFYFYQGNVSAFTSFYWAIVTLSTTGYGDVVPTNFDARIWTICVLIVQLFLLGYLISVVSGIVSEETQHRILGTLGTSMKGHIVVLGYTSVGQAAVRELLGENEKVAVVAETADEVPNLRTLAPESRLYVTYGRPTDPRHPRPGQRPGSPRRDRLYCRRLGQPHHGSERSQPLEDFAGGGLSPPARVEGDAQRGGGHLCGLTRGYGRSALRRRGVPT